MAPRASSNFTLNHPVAPAGGNARASSNFTLSPIAPAGGNARASSNFTLLIDFNIDAENTFNFSTDAGAVVLSPSVILADAANNISFDIVDIVENPAQIVTADNTVQFDTPAIEIANLVLDAASTIQLSPAASENANLGVDADTTVQFDVMSNSTVVVEAITTVEFSTSGEIPAEIDTSKIFLYGAINHQDDNISGPQGGEVECARKMATGGVPSFMPITLISSSEADIDQVYLVEGLGDKRLVERELISLNGSNPVTTFSSFSRLYKITKQSGSPLVGSVLASAGTSMLGMLDDISVTGMETLELRSFLANAVGRATVDTAFYEKFFIKNKTGRTISKLTLSEFQSDFKERILFAGDPAYDDTSTSMNRLTKPGAVNPGDFLTDESLMFEDIPDGASVGIWLRLLIPAGEGTVLHGWKLKLEADGVTKIYDLLHPEGSGLTLANTITMRNLHSIGGGNPLRYVELAGGKFVEQIYYEPDAATFRDQFYYNTRLNRLFKKLNTSPVPVWKVVR